jgi:hypothetical protein
MLKQEHCDLVEELVTEKKKVMRTLESKQKQHNQQQQKPVFFFFRRSWYPNVQCGGVIPLRILHKKKVIKYKKELTIKAKVCIYSNLC